MARAAWHRAAVSLVAGAATFHAAGLARAAPPRTSSLSWVRLEGAEGCPGARELAEAVERLLGRPIFVPPTQAEAAIEGRAERRLAGGYRAIVSMTRPDGSVVGVREFRGGRGGEGGRGEGRRGEGRRPAGRPRRLRRGDGGAALGGRHRRDRRPARRARCSDVGGGALLAGAAAATVFAITRDAEPSTTGASGTLDPNRTPTSIRF